VSTEISVKNKLLLTNFANEGAHVVMDVNVVHQVTDLLELSLASIILTDECLLFAVRTFVDFHQFVVLLEALDRDEL
jgi:hypothetical protein